MSKKEEFKQFVKNNPELLKHVKSGDMTFQKYYEIYDMYGEEESAWKEYKTPFKESNATKAITGAGIGLSLSELFKMLKNVDLDSVQRGIGNVERVLGVLGEMGKKEETPKNTYKPRPVYKHFDD